jgi:hypothetical protein
MARPERKTVDYFPHYISEGKKMFFIEQKYGNDGYASWFKILESLASTDDHFLNLNNEMDILYLSAKCRITKELLIDLLNDLCVFGEIDSFLWQNKIVYSKKFIESIQDAYFRRNNKCMDYDTFCIHYHGLCTTLTPLMSENNDDNTQSKVKYTKVNKTKVETYSFEDSLLNLGADKKLISDWLLVRKNKKATNTETAFDKFKIEFEKSNLTINEVLELCVEKSWSGFKSEWVKESVSLNSGKKEYRLTCPGDHITVFLTEDEFKAKTKTGWWQLSPDKL